MPTTLMGLTADDPLIEITQSVVEVGNASVLVVPKHCWRRTLFLSNDGMFTMYLSFGVPAELHKGYLLAPNSVAVFAVCTTTLYQGDIYAIQDNPTKNKLLIIEGK